MAHEKKRVKDQIQTSHLMYDFSIVSFKNKRQKKHQKFTELVDIVTNELNTIKQIKESHCDGYRKLYNQIDKNYCGECPIKEECLTKCLICTYISQEKRKEAYVLAEKRKQFHVMDLLEERKGIQDRCWNYKIKERKCVEALSVNSNTLPFSCVFGSMGFILNIPFSSSFWANRFRMGLLLNESIYSLNNFPMHRIKYKYEYKKEPKKKSEFSSECIDLFPNSGSKIFVVYIFLQRFSDLSFKTKNSGNRAKYIIELAEYFLGSERIDPKINNHLETYGIDYKKLRMNLFLTYSISFPFVVKAEFKTMKEVSAFITILNCESRISQFSTIIGWHDHDFLLNGSTECELKQPVVLQILFKTSRRVSHVANVFISRLKKHFSPKECDIVKVDNYNEFGARMSQDWIERPFYWDLSIFIETKNLSKLLKFLIEGIDDIKGVITYSVMPIFYSNIDKTTLPLPKTDTKKINEEEDEENVDNSLEESKKTWEKGIECFRNYEYDIPDTVSRVCDDSLLIRWNHLRQECRWLISYTNQLKKIWVYKGNRFNTQEETKGQTPFSKIEKYLTKTLDRILEHDNAFFLLQKNIRLHAKKLEAVMSNELWECYLEINKELNRIKGCLIAIKYEFNTKIEASQIVNLMAPLSTASDPSGVTDLTMEAARRLFKHYCSKPNTESPVWGPRIKENPLIEEWNGIVTSTDSKDFHLISKLQLLYIPIDIKFKTQGKFLILAHEAAHQILYTISNSNQVLQKINHTKETVMESFKKNVWDMLDETLEDWIYNAKRNNKFDKLDLDRFDSIIPEVLGPDNSGKYNFYNHEFLCDILGLLSAGPGYIRPFFNMLYVPRKEDAKKRIHPPMWLRISIMVSICHGLGWLKLKEDKDIINHTDKSTIEEYNQYYDIFEIFKITKHHFQTYETIERINLWEGLLDFDILLQKLDSSEYRFEVALLGALSTMSGKAFLKELVTWLHLHGDNFLYYPLSKEVQLEEENKIDLWRTYLDRVAVRNQFTLHLSDKMVLNNEVILKAPLKYIVAVSCLPDVTHPQYSSGRIIHSLCYAHDSLESRYL